MRTFLVLAAVALGAVISWGLAPHRPFTLFLVGLCVYLLIEVLSLRRRITQIERQLDKNQPHAAMAPTQNTTVRCSPVHPLAPAPPPPRTAPETPPASTGTKPPHPPSRQTFTALIAPVLHFFTRGNPVLKTGLVVLFFGVGFLLNYAAQRNMLPIELRLIGAALGGLTLLAIGWRLRRTRKAYGLSLEGGGIGILYLVVFAAAKLYHLLPLSLALAIMIGLVAFSGLLAVLQHSKGLAVSGSIGGFLAPVLMASGGGSHVLLFSYYGLLNCGILGMAWFKAWRELNLVGFLFTFGLISLWGASAYSPSHFATTEPFLVLFFVMYCLISVLFALRQPPRLRGFIDGPLVFGLPIVASSLQAYLVRDFPYGMALSSLALGLWYIVLARLLWNRFTITMRLLTEAFLALGVVFASLAIPLGLDPHWTIAAWALEGAAMIWVGVRQHRPVARVFGLVLQIGAALAVLDQPTLPADSLIFFNRAFLDCALLAASALFSSFWLDRLGKQAQRWEVLMPRILLAWGLIWWYSAGLVELRRYGTPLQPEAAFLLYASATTAVLAWLLHRFAWSRLYLPLLLLLPMMVFAFVGQVINGGSLLGRMGWLAWPIAFGFQYATMYRYEDQWPHRLPPLIHCVSLWLLLGVLSLELSWRIDQIPGLTIVWSAAMWGLVPTLMLFWLAVKGECLAWPVRRHLHVYRGTALDMPVLALMLWCCASFTLNGNPAPLPYIPLFNPLELIELAILLLAMLRWRRGYTVWPARGQLPLLVLLSFAWLNVVTARSVHFFTNTAYRFEALFAAPVFQAAIAALWALLALSLTIWGARREQRSAWIAGAVLLGITVLKLFVIDLSGTGSIGRIISFLVVGLLMLVIGYFAPLPPKTPKETADAD